jgi:hypothetical protein
LKHALQEDCDVGVVVKLSFFGVILHKNEKRQVKYQNEGNLIEKQLSRLSLSFQEKIASRQRSFDQVFAKFQENASSPSIFIS